MLSERKIFAVDIISGCLINETVECRAKPLLIPAICISRKNSDLHAAVSANCRLAAVRRFKHTLQGDPKSSTVYMGYWVYMQDVYNTGLKTE